MNNILNSIILKFKKHQKTNIFFLLTFVFLAIISSFYIYYTWTESIMVIEDMALKIAQVTEISLNKEVIKQMKAVPEDEGTIAYESIKNSLIELKNLNGDIEFAYIYTKKDHKIYFMVDSEPKDSMDLSPPGQEYTEANSEDLKIFDDGQIIITKPLNDRWGTWISVLVPIIDDQTGKVFAVFGLDYPAETFYNEAKYHTSQASIVVLFAFLILCGFYKLTIKNFEHKFEQEKSMIAEENLSLLISQMQQGHAYHEIITDENGKPIDYRHLGANQSYENITGLSVKDILGKTIKEVMPDVDQYWIDVYGKVALTGESCNIEKYAVQLGKFIDVWAYCPKIGQFAVIVSDITAKKNIEDKLTHSEQQYRLIAENVSDVIWIINVNEERLTYVSPSIMNLRGFTVEEALNETIEQAFNHNSVLMFKNITAEFLNNIKDNNTAQKTYTYEIQQTCKNGETIFVEQSVKCHYNLDGQLELLGVARGIDSRKKQEEKIKYLFYHDDLTNLYNRRYIHENLSTINCDDNFPLTIIVGDINGLKLTNEAFGRDAGDEVIKGCANIIENVCKDIGIVAKWGGDAFIIFLPKSNEEKASEIINEIKTECDKNTETKLSISFGFATKNSSDDDFEAILNNAENKMMMNKIYESASFRGQTINMILSTLHEKNMREEQHSRRVSDICVSIGHALNFPDSEINKLRMIGLVHDIGKIGIDESILNKEGKLDQDEWNEMKKHTEIGYRLLSSTNETSELAKHILGHHERIDGSGYPDGVNGKNISVITKILSIADAYDAMTAHRTYKNSLTHEQAIKQLQENAGTQFDPYIVDVFVNKVLPYSF